MAADERNPTTGDTDDEQWRVYCPIHKYAIPCTNKQTAQHLRNIHNNSPGVCEDSRAKIGKHGAILVERQCEDCDYITQKRFLAEGDDGELRCSPCDKQYNDQNNQNNQETDQ